MERPVELPNGRLVSGSNINSLNDGAPLDTLVNVATRLQQHNILLIPPTSHPYLLGSFSSRQAKVGDIIPKQFQVHPNQPNPVVHVYRLDALSPIHRYANYLDLNTLIVFADGACINNGRTYTRAGYGFVFAPNLTNAPGGIYARLELEGPYGDVCPQTSFRAELRAAIAVLQFRAWQGEGFNHIVIATDSVYVVKGATEWIDVWLQNGWWTSPGQPVQNYDLWLILLEIVAAKYNQGLEVSFWWISQRQNIKADAMAKRGANLAFAPDKFTPIFGIGV